jgi:hypothetical protein
MTLAIESTVRAAQRPVGHARPVGAHDEGSR